MNVVHDEVLALVQKEHDAAAEKYGPIASLHEGYAVLLEEVEETGEEISVMKLHLANLWAYVRHEEGRQFVKISASLLKEHAIESACEAIQVAAVCQRILDREDK